MVSFLTLSCTVGRRTDNQKQFLQKLRIGILNSDTPSILATFKKFEQNVCFFPHGAFHCSPPCSQGNLSLASFSTLVKSVVQKPSLAGFVPVFAPDTQSNNPEMRQIFNGSDTDGSGEINFEEFYILVQAV